MKKTYIVPAMDVTTLDVVHMIANSVKHIGGNSGLELGTEETPDEADVKETPFEW